MSPHAPALPARAAFMWAFFGLASTATGAVYAVRYALDSISADSSDSVAGLATLLAALIGAVAAIVLALVVAFGFDRRSATPAGDSSRTRLVLYGGALPLALAVIPWLIFLVVVVAT